MTRFLSATEEGTKRYVERVRASVTDGHFHLLDGLWASSVGIGTYLGEHDQVTDDSYRDAILRAVELGCNVIDTAINYRFQRSERAIRDALWTLFKEGNASRDEIVVATKVGFLTFDSTPPKDSRAYFMETYVNRGIINPDEIAAGCHCMTPRYIEHQLERSRQNLDLECIDIYYLHNPETQLEDLSPDEFYKRLRAAFETLEQCVADGKIHRYGTATWDGYRTQPDAHNYLSLEEVVAIAKAVGGENHHFKVVQLPYNLAMPEAFALKNQSVAGQMVSLLEAAAHFGITIVASASLMQSRLASKLPGFIREHLSGLDTDAQRAIQFVRSTPGLGIALVGMSQVAHVEENLKVASISPLSRENFMRLFTR